MGLSERQMEIFRELERLLKNGEPVPTVAALGRKFGISQQAMSKNLKTLESEGFIARDPSKHRSLRLLETPPQAQRIPLLGRIAAGQPLETIEYHRTIEVPAELMPSGEVYALEINGDSMIEDGIFDGDIVIIRRQTMAFNGQPVVAVIGGEATLKRYYHEGHRIRLQPANAALQPFYVGPEEEFEIRGVVYALFRKFENDAS